MAIDIIARGLATSLVGSDGKIAQDKMPVLSGTSNLSGFTSIGKLTDASLIEGKTAEEILLMMLYGVVSPTLINPSLSIQINEAAMPLIIGRHTRLIGTLACNRGEISPAYGTSGFRAGAVTGYKVNDMTIPSTVTIQDFAIDITPTSEDVVLSYEVTFAAGEQPLNSIGQPVDKPYPAGAITQTTTLSAAYALYDAAGNELDFELFQDDDGKGYIATFASEGSGVRQSFAVSDNLTVIGVKGYDKLEQKWTWLGGENAKGSLTHFDVASLSGSELGEKTNYTSYTHNQLASGERQLRVYVI